MTIVQSGRADGAALAADQIGEIREIVGEMFDFDEILAASAFQALAGAPA